MAEEKHETPPDQEVQEILGDLDAILSDLGGAPGVPAPPPAAKSPAPAPVPPAAAAAPPPVLKPAVPAPAPKPAADIPGEVSIELGARALPASRPSAPPPEKKPEPQAARPAVAPPPLELDLGGPKAPAPPAAAPPKPAAPPPPPSVPAAAPKAPVAPPPAPAATPAVPARPAQKGVVPPDALPDVPAPDKITKDQIRRVAFIYLGKYEAERDALAKLLDQTAQTVPKKPLFLRRVLYQPLNEEFPAEELLRRIQGAKAVAVLGLVEGVSEPRLRDWTEALSGAGIMFRAIAPLEAGKKSVAIDIVVDAMLLPPEAA